MNNLPAIPEPATTPVPALLDACEAVVAWADSCDDIGLVREVHDRMAAIAEYLARQDHARAAQTAMRRIEVRIGELLGPGAGPGRPPGNSPHAANSGLPNNRASEFRKMAAHPEVVEEVIADSTEQAPPSRSKVLDAIKQLEQVAKEAKAERDADKAWEDGLKKSENPAEDRRRQLIQMQLIGLIDEINDLTKYTPDDYRWALATGFAHVADGLKADAKAAIESLNPYWEVFQ